jgi:hypothetical protein
MKALIKKTDSDGAVAYFTVPGINEDEIDNAVYELMQFACRDSTYPTARYEVEHYNIVGINLKKYEND